MLTAGPLLLALAKTLHNFAPARDFRADFILRVVRHLPLDHKYDLSVFAFAPETRYILAVIRHFHVFYLVRRPESTKQKSDWHRIEWPWCLFAVLLQNRRQTNNSIRKQPLSTKW